MGTANNAPAQLGDTLLTRKQVLARVGMRRTWLREAVRTKRFPAPVRIGSRVLWVEREVAEWIATRLRERPAAGGSRAFDSL